jgi:hypothetical protein
MKAQKTKQPSMPTKGASPADIKAWISACRTRMTPSEAREYEEAGKDLRMTFDALGFDPTTSTFASRTFFVDVYPTT